jgi:hypothetical protein
MIEIAIYQLTNKILFFLFFLSLLITVRYVYMLIYHYKKDIKFEPRRKETIAFAISLAYLISSLFSGIFILS